MKKIAAILIWSVTSVTSNAFDFGSVLNNNLDTAFGGIGGLPNNTIVNNDDNQSSKNIQTLDTSIPNEEFALAKVDKLCENPIADWDVGQNLVDLAVTSVGLWAGGANTADRQQATLNQFKHKSWMPLSLEEKLGDLYHNSHMADKIIADDEAKYNKNTNKNELDKTIDSVTSVFSSFSLGGSEEVKVEHEEEDLSDLGVDLESEACGNFCEELKKGKLIWSRVEKHLNSHPEFKNHPYTWKFHVVRPNEKINGKVFNKMAVAMPGGHIYLGSGLIQDNSISQKAVEMLLVHEASHSLKRHHTKKVQGLLVDSLGSIDKIKKITTSGASELENMAEVVAIFSEFDKIINGFPRAQEYEADACSVRAYNNHYHVHSLKEYIKDNTSNSNPNYGTHGERIDNLDTVSNKIH